MNNDRRNRIALLISEMDDITARIEALQEEEQEAYDAMPEGLQSSERGEQAYGAADALSNAASYANDIRDYLDNARQ